MTQLSGMPSARLSSDLAAAEAADVLTVVLVLGGRHGRRTVTVVNTGFEIIISMLLASHVPSSSTSTSTLNGASVTLNVAPPPTGSVLKLIANGQR